MRHVPVEYGCVTLVSKDGADVWQVWLDGRIEGFPDGTVVLNGAEPCVNRRVAEAWLKGRAHSTLRARLRRAASAFVRAFHMGRSPGVDASRQPPLTAKGRS